MSIKDRVTNDDRRKYLRVMQEHYLQADRKERGRLLDEMETAPWLMQQLDGISISTVGRIVARIRQDEPRLPAQESYMAIISGRWASRS